MHPRFQPRLKVAVLGAALSATMAMGVLGTPLAQASGRPLGRPVSTAGVCTDGTSTFTLKSMFDDAPFPQTVGAEFQVITGVVGQTWQVTLTDNGATFFNAPVVTNTAEFPQGGFNVTRPDAGSFSIAHTIVATAVNQANGAVCTGTVTDQPIQ
jgi:hypothetical protein